jgi:hypothetical protein
MLEAEVGMTSVFKLEQPENADPPTSVTVSGITIDFKTWQFQKAKSPMTWLAMSHRRTRWIATLAREAQPTNAPRPMRTHPSPIVTDARDAQ